ncbi:uncharacterized protein BCR38DRAFT_152811 [Pseudomassariella vexata]|uniref:Zn(2)-C6 fungal-type domain-containing protein n=1 Tax=Pseudomassariella vexata TaxID=1141098 RepID=A0A1Y2E6L0_9PEZI|nr:uncharacterized protein BCR38DRAFT_152811 [Pseudomassariella vexata]ORY67198.1 hypothetical protein BCR38DRAFT_152811 [Pseudomassariella vexata]
MGSDVQFDPSEYGGADAIEKKPRNRIRFSCTICREKKLKCDRALPCDQCLKRSIQDSCEYVPYLFPKSSTRLSRASSRVRSTPDVASLQHRLHHLEQLVQVLKTQPRDDIGLREIGKLEWSVAAAASPEAKVSSLGDHFEYPLGITIEPDTLNNTGQSRMQDAPGWEALLDEIVNLTHSLRITGQPHDDTNVNESQLPETRGPMLLLGAFAPTTMTELLQALPSKAVVDRLVAAFFQDKNEPGRVILHVPSFLRHYDNFWRDLSQSPIIFMCLIFGTIAHVALVCHFAKKPVPGIAGDPMEVVHSFLTRMAQCLAVDDYTKPGKWKLEALILYFGGEYLRLTDAQVGTSVLLSTIVKLAMHSGYHRDPKHNKKISAFEGEMRRRLWRILLDVDAVTAFQFGIPLHIAPGSYDTEPPRNLHDEDFDETTSELPPPRPLTELTRVLPSILKEKVESVFVEIQATIYSTNPVRYERIMELDSKLKKSWQSIPPVMRMRDFVQSIADPLDLVLQRYQREILYQKCRSVLHRRYLNLGRSDHRFSYSRWTCLDAAAKTMRHQYDIHFESQPFGRLASNNWLQNSLLTHDFLLAAMILCLELSYLLRSESVTQGRCLTDPNFTKDQLLEILRTSRKIWEQQRKESSEAQRAYQTISRMIAVATGMENGDSPESSGSSEPSELPQPAAFPSPQTYGYPFDDFNAMRDSQAPVHPSSSSVPASAWGPIISQAQSDPWALQVPATDLTNLDSINWSMWDNQIRGIGSEMPQIPWNTFFQQHGQ